MLFHGFLYMAFFVRKTKNPPGLGTPWVPRTEAEALGRVFGGSGVGKLGKKITQKKRFKELIILQIPHLSFGIFWHIFCTKKKWQKKNKANQIKWCQTTNSNARQMLAISFRV